MLFCGLFISTNLPAQSNVTVRVMAANLNGNTQSIQPFEINIYKGLKPDVVCLQEFNYLNNAASDFRSLLDNAFGTNFVYYRESGSLQIPNGIISRYPIIESGRWVDTQVSNRGFAWARIDLPGTNDLYAVSVHLLTTGSGNRATEANNLKALILANFPANAWIVIGGDFNTTSRTESAITTFAGLCPDSPIPTDAETGGSYFSNANRKKPYDYVLASTSFTNYLTNVVFASHSFSRGLVFDSRVYTPLSDVSPVVIGDSGQGQHMAVLKDFSIPVTGGGGLIAPIINTQPQSQIVSVGAPATFSVTANGTTPLSYQWRFNGTNILGAITNSFTIASAQTTNNGPYLVVITNSAGSITSSVATLTVSNTAPIITTPPADLSVYEGDTAAFSVVAGGTSPLGYQWRFNGTNIAGATSTDYSFNNARMTNAGNYSVVITNLIGSVTSVVAVLTVNSAVPVILTQPTSLTVSQGDQAGFTVEAGGASPLDYQWRFNGANLPSATDNPLTIAAAQLSDAGNYSVVVTNFAGSVTSATVALTVNENTSGILAQWNFNSSPADGNTSTGTTNPSVGNGTASVIGGLTTVSQYFGGGGADTTATDNSAWSPGAYPAATVNNKQAGVKFSVSTLGKQSISISWSSQASGSASKYARLQYTTNGTDFTDFTSPVTNANGTFSTRTNILSSISGVNNNANFAFRIVTEFESTAISNANASYVGAGGTYGTGGNLRYDMVTVYASTITATNPPAAAPMLGAVTFGVGQLQFNVSGTAGSNYIVLSATNLAAPNWIPLRTNPAPFTFTETNLVPSQKFYRAVAQ